MKDVEIQNKDELSNATPNSSPHQRWTPLSNRSKINSLWIFAICANQITTSFIWIPLGVLTKPMCNKLGLSHIATTLVLMIGSVIGFIVPPIVAAISDSTTFKYGRRRIFLIIGEILLLAGLLMIGFCREISSKFNTIENSQLGYNNSAAIFYFITGQILAFVGGNIANGPGRAMCSDVVPASQQVLVSNICVFDSAISGVIANSIGAFHLYTYTNLTNETFVLVVSAVIGLIALLISVVCTPEERLVKKPQMTNPITIIFDSIKSINKDFLFVLLGFFFYSLGAIEFSVQASHYIAGFIFGGDPMKNDGVYDSGVSYAQFLSLFTTISQVCFSFVNTKIVNKLGFRGTWIMGEITLILSNLSFYLFTNKYLLIIPYILIGITGVIAYSLPYAYVSIVTPTEKLAGSMTLIILFGNIGCILGMLFLTMYLGSFAFFQENPGRIVAVSSIFAVLGLVFGKIGYSIRKHNNPV